MINSIKGIKKFLGYSKEKKTFFGYDAIKYRSVRRNPISSVRSEDAELEGHKRKLLIGTTKDQVRNISIVAWMLRKHLDYVSRFTFHALNKDVELNRILDKLWKDYNHKNNCDIAGRHSLSGMMRLFEASKVIDGDAGLYMLPNGKLQGIEGSRISSPNNMSYNDKKKLVNGLVLNEYGGVEKYAIVKEEHGRTVFDRYISAEDMLFDGYFTRFDQARGVSPLSTGLDIFINLYKAFDYQLIKAKLHAMYGVVVSSDSQVEGDGFDTKDRVTGEAPTAETEGNGYSFEIKEGAMKIELGQGDTIKTFESQTPSNEFQSYSELMLRLGMLSFDLPYSFFSSVGATYSSMKQDRIEYENSSRFKQEANREIMIQLSDWKHQQWIDEGLLPVDNIEEIKFNWRFTGRPWIEELKEVTAAKKRIEAGLSSGQREAKAHGDDWFEMMTERKAEQEFAIDNAVPVTIGDPGQATIQEKEDERVMIKKDDKKEDIKDDKKDDKKEKE